MTDGSLVFAEEPELARGMKRDLAARCFGSAVYPSNSLPALVYRLVSRLA